MKKNVELRELKKQYLPALKDVIRKTWDYDKFATPKTVRKLARFYLATCLTNQTYTRVAEVNGVPVGLIFGKDIEKTSLPAEIPPASNIRRVRTADFQRGTRYLEFL